MTTAEMIQAGQGVHGRWSEAGRARSERRKARLRAKKERNQTRRAERIHAGIDREMADRIAREP